MPVRDGEAYLAQAVESVLGQTLDDLELIVVDDGSTDSSLEILERFAAADPRIRVVSDATSSGISAALNRGWREASGPYIARLDADDVALPDRLERQARFLDENPAVAVVGSAAIMIDPNGRELGIAWTPTDARTIHSTLQRRNCLIHPSVLIRRTALNEAGGYRFDHVEDYDLWLRIAERHELANLPEPMILYRVHPAQVSLEVLDEQVRRSVAVRKAAGIRRREGVDPLTGVDELTPAVVARLKLDEREVAGALESEWLARASLLEQLGEVGDAARLVAQAAGRLGPRAERASVAARELRNAEELRAAGRLAPAVGQVASALRHEPRYTLSRLRVWSTERLHDRRR
jgi:hypothetical protein